MKKFLFLLLLGIIPLYAVGVGDKAPDFTLEKLSGGNITLSDYQGKIVYIFFFGWG